MKVIGGGRSSGRTDQLIKACAEAEKAGLVSYMVCHSEPECQRIFKRAKELGHKNFPFPITFNNFAERGYSGHNIDCFFIDNADRLLQFLTPVVVDTIVIEE